MLVLHIQRDMPSQVQSDTEPKELFSGLLQILQQYFEGARVVTVFSLSTFGC